RCESNSSRRSRDLLDMNRAVGLLRRLEDYCSKEVGGRDGKKSGRPAPVLGAAGLVLGSLPCESLQSRPLPAASGANSVGTVPLKETDAALVQPLDPRIVS